MICPECNGTGSIYNYFDDAEDECPACKATGEVDDEEYEAKLGQETGDPLTVDNGRRELRGDYFLP